MSAYFFEGLGVKSDEMLELGSTMSAKLLLGELEPEAVRDATWRAFSILKELNELNKAKAEAEKKAAAETGALSSISAVWRRIPSPKPKPDPAETLYSELASLLAARPCLVDLDARHRYKSIVSNYALIHQAAESGLERAALMLLDAGTPIDAMCDNGSALCVAIAYRHPSLALQLMERGANVNAAPIANNSLRSIPIFRAAIANNAELVIALCARGADPNQLYGLDHPLLETRFGDNVDSARALIDCGANPNLHTSYRTALGSASRGSSPTYITLLLDAGADLTLRNVFSESPLEEAKSWNTNNPDQENRTRLALYTERFETATAAWQAFEIAGASEDITARDLVLFANVGKFDEAMDHRFWRGQEEHARELLHRLPPWMATQAMKHQLWLTHTEPSTEISGIELFLSSKTDRGVSR